MVWNTKLINQIVDNYDSGCDIKTIIRDITIDEVLNNGKSKIKFPFIIDPGHPSFSHLKSGREIFSHRSPNLIFKYTKEEESNIISLSLNPIDIFKYINHDSKKYHKSYFDSLSLNRFNIMILSRQIGATESALISALQYIISNYDKRVVFISRNKDLVDRSVRFNRLYESLPFYLKPGIADMRPTSFKNTGNKSKISFDNGNSIDFITYDEDIRVHYDYYIYEDLGYISSSNLNKLYQNHIPIWSTRVNTKVLIFGNNLGNIINNSNFAKFTVSKYNWDMDELMDYNRITEIIDSIGLKSFMDEYMPDRDSIHSNQKLRDFKLDSLIK